LRVTKITNNILNLNCNAEISCAYSHTQEYIIFLYPLPLFVKCYIKKLTEQFQTKIWDKKNSYRMNLN